MLLFATDHFNNSPVCENLAQCGALFAWEDNCHFLLMLSNIFSQFVTINTAQCEDVKINCRNRHSWTKRSFLSSFLIQYWMTFLNVGLEPASARKTSEPAVKTTPPNIAPTLLTRTLTNTTKSDEFLEKFQTAFNPPLHFLENYIENFL